jgi:hypothetical protein
MLRENDNITTTRARTVGDNRVFNRLRAFGAFASVIFDGATFAQCQCQYVIADHRPNDCVHILAFILKNGVC